MAESISVFSGQLKRPGGVSSKERRQKAVRRMAERRMEKGERGRGKLGAVCRVPVPCAVCHLPQAGKYFCNNYFAELKIRLILQRN